MYDSFESLPDEIQSRINALIEPTDPEAWVKKPIPALDGRTFLDVINGDGGDQIVAQYFGRVEAFEGPAAQPAPEDLGKIFHFDEADLDANRAGLLSASQRTRLWRQDMLKILGAAVCLVAGTVYNIGELAGWLPVPTHGRGAVLGIALILLGLVLAVWSAQTWLDLTPGSVLVANGYLHQNQRTVSGRYGQPITVYCFQIGNETFDVPIAAYDALHEGNRRLYYLRRTRTVLSVESLQK
ncbi:MAG TPA: hypothetical protein VF383_11690 [Candidatus Dormibacteraeota bacterium]